jgi:hypothetical protein
MATLICNENKTERNKHNMDEKKERNKNDCENTIKIWCEHLVYEPQNQINYG